MVRGSHEASRPPLWYGHQCPPIAFVMYGFFVVCYFDESSPSSSCNSNADAAHLLLYRRLIYGFCDIVFATHCCSLEFDDIYELVLSLDVVYSFRCSIGEKSCSDCAIYGPVCSVLGYIAIE